METVNLLLLSLEIFVAATFILKLFANLYIFSKERPEITSLATFSNFIKTLILNLKT